MIFFITIWTMLSWSLQLYEFDLDVVNALITPKLQAKW